MALAMVNVYSNGGLSNIYDKLPIASEEQKGVVQIGNGLIVDSDGVIDVAQISTSSETRAGLMTAADKKKLNGIASGAQVNVIEKIAVNNVNQTITNKTVNLDLSKYAEKSKLNILSTVPSTTEGGIWYEFENHMPVLKLYYGGQVFSLAGEAAQALPKGAQSYFITSGAQNSIEHYGADDIIFLDEGLDLFDAKFVTRNECKDLLLTFTNGTTATVGSTVAATTENLSTNGRAILIIDANERRHNMIFYTDGRIVESGAITLTSDYANSSFTATNQTTISSAKSPFSITGGTTASSLRAGANSDTLTGKSGNDTFTGGAGADLFVVKLTGGNTITDFNASADKISLTSGNISNLTGATTSGGNLALEFGSGSLTLQDFASNAAVTIDNTPYVFGDNAIFNSNRTAVTLLAPVTVNCTSETLYSGTKNVNAKNGGSIKAANSGVTLTGSDATFVGGNGADNFTFSGGDITIQSYAAADCVSLASNYTLASYNYDATTSRVTLNVNNSSNDSGTIVLDTLDADTAVTLWQNGQSSTHNFAKFAIFNNDDSTVESASPANAVTATLLTQYGDFGIQNEDGSEYYGSLYTITASQENSTIIANVKANAIEIIGGENNVITGGMGKDTFYFRKGGGVITDFGIGTTKNGAGKTLATKTTQQEDDSYTAYNRHDPESYAEGIDILHVKGTVTKIAFPGHGDKTTGKFPHSSFNATVYYKADADGKTYSIELQNIAKKATTTSSTNTDKQKFQTDDAAAENLKIWDTHTGSMAVLSATALSNLFSTS